MLEVVGVSTWQRLGAGGLTVTSVSSVVEARFVAGLKPRMNDAMSVNSNLVQLINISQDNSRFKQINFSESSDFQQLRRLSTRR